MADGILPTANHGSALTPRAYNVPGLSPIDFLRAVMEATNLPLSYRIEAAKALLPFTTTYPRSAVRYQGYDQCIIRIGGLGPLDPDPGSANDLTGNHSQNRVSPKIPVTHADEAGDPQNLTRYSDPPTPAELQEIKAAINRLRPDLADQPIPELHLCPCGHWVAGEYDCCRALASRDPSKMN